MTPRRTRVRSWQDLDLEHDFHEVETLPENDRVRYTISPSAPPQGAQAPARREPLPRRGRGEKTHPQGQAR